MGENQTNNRKYSPVTLMFVLIFWFIIIWLINLCAGVWLSKMTAIVLEVNVVLLRRILFAILWGLELTFWFSTCKATTKSKREGEKDGVEKSV